MIPPSQTALQSSVSTIGLNIALGIVVLIYVTGWLRMRAAFPNLISIRRLAAFSTGLLCIWIAIGSPLAGLDAVSLTVHMVQHLLLMTIAPPLILLGAPAVILLRGLPQSIPRHVLRPVLRSSAFKRLGHTLTNPVICWLAAALVLICWHVPAVFELAMQLDWLHKLEQASFLVSGLLFWWPVILPWPTSAKWPRWSMPLYLFCATLPCDILSGFLVFCDRLVYMSYMSAPRFLGMTALEDQQCAAALMWVSVTFIFLIPAFMITMQMLCPPNSSQPERTWAAQAETPRQVLDPSRLWSI
jgi:putative membrane protein